MLETVPRGTLVHLSLHSRAEMVAGTYVRYVRCKLDMCGTVGLQTRYVRCKLDMWYYKSSSATSQIGNFSYLRLTYVLMRCTYVVLM